MRGYAEITGTAIVCILDTDPSMFTDNVPGTCHFCARRVKHRPHVPTPNTLICVPCFASRAEPGDEVEISRATRRELADVIRRN